MQNSLVVALAPLWRVLIQFSFKYDAISYLGCLATTFAFSYSILIQIGCKLPCQFCCAFLYVFRSDAKSFLVCLAATLALPCSILIQTWQYHHLGVFSFSSYLNLMQNPLLAALPLRWRVLIQFIFKYNAKPSLSCCVPSLMLSYWIITQTWL